MLLRTARNAFASCASASIWSFVPSLLRAYFALSLWNSFSSAAKTSSMFLSLSSTLIRAVIILL